MLRDGRRGPSVELMLQEQEGYGIEPNRKGFRRKHGQLLSGKELSQTSIQLSTITWGIVLDVWLAGLGPLYLPTRIHLRVTDLHHFVAYFT